MNRKEINTMDKYKGHTPAPWFYYDDGGISSSIRLYHQPYMNSDGDDTEEDLAEIHYDENCIADARLMADAPLILQALIDERAEVKRLRSILGNIKGIEMDWGIDFNHASITVTHFTGLMLSGELKLEMMD